MIYILPTDTCYGIACAFDDKKNYEKIYKIKKRSFEKPLALMVESFDWLREHSDLTDEQVNFLENYEHPFTILTHSSPIELFLNYQDDSEECYINKDVYKKIAFRVAQNDFETSLVSQFGPIWLTSANISDTPEIYTPEKIEDVFEYYLEHEIIELMGTTQLDASVPPSDIFEFIDDSLEREYLRKH